MTVFDTTSPQMVPFESSPFFTRATGTYGEAIYGDGTYGLGEDAGFALLDESAPAFATFAASASLLFFDTPEPQ